MGNNNAAMSAHNTNSNFGGLNLSCRVNVPTEVKTALQRKVIGSGSQAYIVHNTCRIAMDAIAVDVEHLLRKVLRYIYIYTSRIKASKNACDFVGKVYQTGMAFIAIRFLVLIRGNTACFCFNTRLVDVQIYCHNPKT